MILYFRDLKQFVSGKNTQLSRITYYNVRRTYALRHMWCPERLPSIYNAGQDISVTLALFVPNICARLLIGLLINTNEWRKNVMTRSGQSCCIRCMRWVKLAKTSCFLETAKLPLNRKYFGWKHWKAFQFFHVSWFTEVSAMDLS